MANQVPRKRPHTGSCGQLEDESLTVEPSLEPQSRQKKLPLACEASKKTSFKSNSLPAPQRTHLLQHPKTLATSVRESQQEGPGAEKSSETSIKKPLSIAAKDPPPKRLRLSSTGSASASQHALRTSQVTALSDIQSAQKARRCVVTFRLPPGSLNSIVSRPRLGRFKLSPSPRTLSTTASRLLIERLQHSSSIKIIPQSIKQPLLGSFRTPKKYSALSAKNQRALLAPITQEVHRLGYFIFNSHLQHLTRPYLFPGYLLGYPHRNPTAAEIAIILQGFHPATNMPYNNAAIPPPEEITGSASLPLARVKKILKIDEDTPEVSNNAAFVITIATEMFIRYLSEQALNVVKSEKKPRRNVQYKDVANAVARIDNLQFLEDVIPRTMTYREYKARKASKAPREPAALQNGQMTIDASRPLAQRPIASERAPAVADDASMSDDRTIDEQDTEEMRQQQQRQQISATNGANAGGLVFEHYEPNGNSRRDEGGDVEMS